MGIAKDRDWKEGSLDGAMGKWVHCVDCFGVLKAWDVRFLKDGEPLAWKYFGPQGTSGLLQKPALLDAVSGGRLSYLQLTQGTLLGADRRPLACGTVELNCALDIYANTYKTFTVKGLGDFYGLRFLLVGEALPSPHIQDIREGGRYYYDDRRPDEDVWLDVRVTKVYDYPSEDRICDVLAQDGQTIAITLSNLSLLTCTYPDAEGIQIVPAAGADGFGREEEELQKEGVRATELLPHADREGQTVNICWLKVKGAASYRVTLFRCVTEPFPVLYRLASYDTDRDTCFLSLSGLIGSGLLFRVSALDRAGEEIARTRGISL